MGVFQSTFVPAAASHCNGAGVFEMPSASFPRKPGHSGDAADTALAVPANTNAFNSMGAFMGRILARP
jgi:hypothetical protein